MGFVLAPQPGISVCRETSPTPRPSAVTPSCGTENEKWQQTGEGPVVFKAGCTESLCLRRFRAVVFTNIALSSASESIFSSCSIQHR